MRIYYYEAPGGNVGDDLNRDLWPLAFGDGFFRADDPIPFVAIGSILDDRHNVYSAIRPVVFGTGMRSARARPTYPERFDIRFVRGPRSAAVLSHLGVRYISDPAILAPLFIGKDQPAAPVKGRIGYVPYFESPDHLSRDIVQATGVHLVPPTLPPAEFVRELQTCERIVTEAMHGAILADAYRIPWQGCRLLTGIWEGRASLFKWGDWMDSLGISTSLPNTLPQASLYAPRKLRGLLSGVAQSRAVATVERIIKADRWHLSDPTRLSTAQSDILSEIERLKRDYPGGCLG